MLRRRRVLSAATQRVFSTDGCRAQACRFPRVSPIPEGDTSPAPRCHLSTSTVHGAGGHGGPSQVLLPSRSPRNPVRVNPGLLWGSTWWSWGARIIYEPVGRKPGAWEMTSPFETLKRPVESSGHPWFGGVHRLRSLKAPRLDTDSLSEEAVISGSCTAHTCPASALNPALSFPICTIRAAIAVTLPCVPTETGGLHGVGVQGPGRSQRVGDGRPERELQDEARRLPADWR
ncbi:uncharacterized protein LOC111732656 [Pteropus vampyrus]|uniref:Uncharacterized protein LOC111732656 n=1 Tax=Pteropus vampyrus TaxID=132908 RepID=A0A6P6BZN0_PTEVA|nr:uncharacterized protein LOC111732656 [Pteropus vampyrus]